MRINMFLINQNMDFYTTQNSIGVAAEPYHIVPETTKADQKTAAILLERTVSIFPIRKTL
jgi:hypothetical protein